MNEQGVHQPLIHGMAGFQVLTHGAVYLLEGKTLQTLSKESNQKPESLGCDKGWQIRFDP